MANPLKLQGIEFVEFASPYPYQLHQLFLDFGFSKMAQHESKNIDLYRQGQIRFHLNYQLNSFASRFSSLHGPSITSMGWRFENAEYAFAEALRRGAKQTESDYVGVSAIEGIGQSAIYFIDSSSKIPWSALQDPICVKEKGFKAIDHLTNNVENGTMQAWAKFYKDIFEFSEVRYFDIKGQKTGLTSYALRSPCGTFCIPINEASEKKSQINEFLEEYNGPGIQHLAFLTDDLIASLQSLKNTKIDTLSVSPLYYEKAFQRVPKLREDKQLIRELNVLVDGDEEGYLLQIFTKKLIGPIFIEMIQRCNHLSFGEGNFQALFDSIERDQMKRGVL